MKVLDVFSGIGGFSLGLERAGMETVAFCEIDEYCQKILHKHWKHIPIYNDIRELTGDRLRKDGIKEIDIVCGGFPCQPFSVAGRKKGTADDRDLWSEMCRIIEETKPTWVIGENVANFTNMAFTRTKIDLESRGYEVQPFIIPACATGAPHQRKRVWIIAHAPKLGLEAKGKKQQAARSGRDNWWQSEPRVCRVANGIPNRMDRIKGLGNAVVPQIVEIIGKMILSSTFSPACP